MRASQHTGRGLLRTRERSVRKDVDQPAHRNGEGEAFERNIYQHLAGILGREIVSGFYPPGTLLPNAIEMCKRFAVSRTALREAYGLLTAKALIVARPKVGTRVRPKAEWNVFDPDVLAWHMQSSPTESFVADLYVLREMVEPAAAALAASARSRATIEQISEAYARMERFKDGAGDLIDADLQFHMAILKATENHFLNALGSLIRASLQCAFKFSWAGAARIQDDRLHQHRAVLEAIRNGSPELARARMADLLRDSFSDVREFLRHRDSSLEAAGNTQGASPRRG